MSTSSNLAKVLIGHDVEGFLHDGRQIISAIGKIGGTKYKPLPVEGSSTGLCLQEDNVTVELNNTPVEVGPDFRNRFDLLMDQSLSEATAYVRNKLGRHYRIMFSPTAEFPREVLAEPKAAEFGCEPDFLAHRFGEMRPALSAKEILKEAGPVRFAGGHVHIGYDKTDSFMEDWALIQLIEAYCYYPRLAQDRQHQRRMYYGKAGLYRPKKYGVEYRTPSNFWIEATSFVRDVALFSQAVLSSETLAKELYASVDHFRVSANINDPNYNSRGDALSHTLSARLQEIVRENAQEPRIDVGDNPPEPEDDVDDEEDREDEEF